jgi:allophanate hydrolase
LPLNHELVELGGCLERVTRTSADYRLHALVGTRPPKPGLCRVRTGGVAIEAEIWSLPASGFGRFVARVPRPLAIGHVTLEDGSEVAGFVCEPDGLVNAPDVSDLGGWRAYLTAGREPA